MAEKQNSDNDFLYSIIVHRLGSIRCFCGYNGVSHECIVKGKIKFSKCYEDECPLCYEEYNYSLQRYQRIDGYLSCRQCKTKLGCSETICTDCFCGICFAFRDDCDCCKICNIQSNGQCCCYDSDTESNNGESNSTNNESTI